MIFRFLVLAIIASIASEAFAETLQPKQFIEEVLRSHPALSATAQEINSAQGELLANQGSFDPSLKFDYQGYPKGGYSGQYSNVYLEQPLELFGSKLTAGYRKGNGSFPVYEDYFDTNTNGEARAGFEVPLLRDGLIDRRRASIQRAFKQIEGAKLSFNQRQVELARAAAMSYWQWVASYAKRSAYRNLLDTAKRRDKQLIERVKAGDLAEFESTDNQRQVLQREGQLVAADREFFKSENDLALFFWTSNEKQGDIRAMEPPKLLPLPTSYIPASLEAAQETAIKQRVEQKRIENQLEQQEVERNLANNQFLPRLDFQAFASKDQGEGSSTKEEAEIKAGIKFELPLAYRTQTGKLEVIEAKQRELKFQKSLIEQRIAIEVKDSINSLELALSRARIARNEVNVAKKLEVGEQARFEQGDSNLIFLNLREQASVDAVVREIDAISDCWKSYVTYRAASGAVDLYPAP